MAEDAITATRSLLKANPLNRPILLRILKACASERVRLNDLEDYVLACPEFNEANQPPYFLIQWLVEPGVLEEIEVDAEDKGITAEQKEGKTEDEIDDMVEDLFYLTTPDGLTIMEEFDPKNRIMELLAIKPDRYDTYIEVLEYLKDKHSMADVDKILRGRDVLTSGRVPGDRPMQPSVFIDKLAVAGGIAWDSGWQITEEGSELLEAIKAKQD
jgi:hypothetical protein